MSRLFLPIPPVGAPSRLAAAFVLAASLAAAAEEPAPTPWPTAVVTWEQLQPLTRYELKVPRLVTQGTVTGPAALRVHVDAEGQVAKVRLVESCGNADLDEAAMRAMRTMRFRPHREDGAPVAVTLAVPVHVPKRLGQTERVLRP